MKRLLLACTFALGSCGDPVHSDAVDALGGETYGQSPGPLHRPGQPCLVCHGGAGPGSPEFAVGGTVFASQNKLDFLDGAVVVLKDATGKEVSIRTNANGNFYIPASDWSIAYPLTAKVELAGKSQVMRTTIGRDGACASCHSDPVSARTVGHVYMNEGP